jgi:phytoene desaturase
MQTAVFRPSIKSKKVGNLYYTGQYTHPGVGVPMVMISAQVAADVIKGDNA